MLVAAGACTLQIPFHNADSSARGVESSGNTGYKDWLTSDCAAVSVDCPACGSSYSSVLFPLRDHYGDETFDCVRCTECEFRYLNPAPPPARLEHYYAANDSGACMRRPPSGLFRALQRIAFAQETRPLRRRLQGHARILDLGAGDGALVKFFEDRGYTAGAADFYPPADWLYPEIPYRNLDLHGGSLTAANLRSILGSAPDAVTLRHVLEHLHEPRKVLQAVHEAGTEWIYIVVPNCDSPFARAFGESWYYWDPPRHLHFFNRATLSALCARSGYTVEQQGYAGIDEIVTSAHRKALLSPTLPARRTLIGLTRPKGIVAGLSSAFSAPWGRAVCWCLARRAT